MLIDYKKNYSNSLIKNFDLWCQRYTFVFWIIEIISLSVLSFLFLILFSSLNFVIRIMFLLNDLVYFIEWELIRFIGSRIVIRLVFDWISLLFISFVRFISSLVILYSKEYISHDININRFLFLVLLFVLSIIFLIISPNLIRILLGWDGLGLVSYLLIIYFQNVKSFNAGILTALRNRIGDVAILLRIAWILNFGDWNFYFIFNFLNLEIDFILIRRLILLAAITKRAQIPFSAWLPAAIAAPTPVSALVHSSTLVTAGVYLLIRFNVILLDSFLGKFLLLIGGLTIFMAGLGANYEIDLKKIIALSTLRQLGLIIRILALGFFKLAFFHLLTHALFKSLLFICAGVIIHQIKNSQDIRFIGGFINFIPLTRIFFSISNLALCGIPFLAGFYSKDIILEIVYIINVNIVIFFLFVVSTGLTVCYSFRLFYYSLIRNYGIFNYVVIFDNFNLILKRIFGLLIISILGGRILRWLIFPVPYFIFLPINLKLLTLEICFIGGILGRLIFIFKGFNLFTFKKRGLLISFFRIIWFIPAISTFGVIKYPLKVGFNTIILIDQGWSEIFGGQIIFKNIINYSFFFQKLYFNNIKIYLLFFVLWVIILFFLNFKFIF